MLTKKTLIYSIAMIMLLLNLAILASFRIKLYSLNSSQYLAPVQEEIIAIRIINTTTIHVGDVVNLSTVISNPTTWTLINISFFLILPSDIIIISSFNESPIVETKLHETEEGYNISAKISTIERHQVFAHWLIIKFKKDGIYEIPDSTITFRMKKGELIEEGTINCPAIMLKVQREIKRAPPEGKTDALFLIILTTILAPLGILAVADKIAAKEK